MILIADLQLVTTHFEKPGCGLINLRNHVGEAEITVRWMFKMINMPPCGLPDPCAPQPTKYMKYHHSPRGGRTLILGIACLGLGQAFAQNETPRGTLTVDNTLVRVGTQSQLTWNIQYPVTITDIVEVTSQTITPKEELQLRVRILGSKLRTDSGHGNNVDGMDSSNTGNKSNNTIDLSGSIDDERSGTQIGDQPVEVVWSKNKSAWSRIFYGSQSTVVATDVVLDTVVAKGDIVDFGARGYLNSWLPLYCTSTTCRNLIVLKNGDPTPPQIASKQYGQITGFLKPYLSTDAKTVKIGATELLILVELDQTEPLAVGFDYQDLGMLVTFD
jgi:hypothetical protein